MRSFTQPWLCILLGIVAAFGCQSSPSTEVEGNAMRLADRSAASERDEIYSLLAYAVVYKDWQANRDDRRGYNIGAVLVNPEGKVVSWGRNANHITGNSTQHAEVRTILRYLNEAQSYHLRGYTLYTTLEPCAQCAGMMMLARIKRAVYGHSDPGFGKAAERLALDTSDLPKLLPDRYQAGYEPYPRTLDSEASVLDIRRQLDQAYAQSGVSITHFLHSHAAKDLFAKANGLLRDYQPRFSENQPVLRQALDFLETEVTARFDPIYPRF